MDCERGLFFCTKLNKKHTVNYHEPTYKAFSYNNGAANLLISKCSVSSRIRAMLWESVSLKGGTKHCAATYTFSRATG